MTKSATDVMQEIIFSAVIDSIVALKAASKGVPNTLLRDLNAIHANTTFADLPKDLQATVTGSVRAAFTRLLKEGYTVSSGQAAPARSPAPRRDGGGRAGPRPEGPRREGPKREGPRREGGGPPRGDGAPGKRGDNERGRPPRAGGGGGAGGRPPRSGGPRGGRP